MSEAKTENPASVITERQEHILIMRMNRAHKKNALTREMYRNLTQGLQTASEDGHIRVVLITGSGDSFTSGNDVMDFMQEPPTGEDSAVFQFLKAIVTFKKPVIAAVNGVAVGIGTTMLLHCDLAYSAPEAVYRMPFVSLGLCPEAASSYIIPRMVGLRKASELLLLGDKFSAEKACEYGIVNEVCPAEELFEFALSKAKQLAALPPASVRLTKELLKRYPADSIAETMSLEGDHFIERLTSPEAAEAFTAFAERRKPDFSAFE